MTMDSPIPVSPAGLAQAVSGPQLLVTLAAPAVPRLPGVPMLSI